jgi:hypothetical protein
MPTAAYHSLCSSGSLMPRLNVTCYLSLCLLCCLSCNGDILLCTPILWTEYNFLSLLSLRSEASLSSSWIKSGCDWLCPTECDQCCCATSELGQKTDQWNRIADANMNPHSCSWLIFDKGAQDTRWRKDSLFNKCCWENWISTCRRQKLDPCLSPCTKINSKWIKDLHIRAETLKLLQEAVGNTLEQIGIGNNFINWIQKAEHLRETMNK